MNCITILYLLSELALPAIAVSLATSLVAAPYLLIRNYYHLYPGQATKAGDLGENSERKRRSGVE